MPIFKLEVILNKYIDINSEITKQILNFNEQFNEMPPISFTN